MHYVCSDIHGQFDLYARLIHELDLQNDDVLYILGDVIDRGPEGVKILKDVMVRNNIEFLLGNHETMMLDYYDGIYKSGIWLSPGNGGDVTRNEMDRLPKTERAQILQYLKSSLIQKRIIIGGLCYSLQHSCPVPGFDGDEIRFCDDLSRSRIFHSVWYSPYRHCEKAGRHHYTGSDVFIIGHVPVQYVPENEYLIWNEDVKEEDVRPPYIDFDGVLYNIDGGCARIEYGEPGGLYCMSLEIDTDGRRKEFWITPDMVKTDQD